MAELFLLLHCWRWLAGAAARLFGARRPLLIIFLWCVVVAERTTRKTRRSGGETSKS